jgi:hypothetical protein
MPIEMRSGRRFGTRSAIRRVPQSVAAGAIAAVAGVAAAATVAMGATPSSAPAASSSAAATPAAAPASTRRAQFSLVATVPGRYGSYSPWSPSAPLFAYCDDQGVVVIDVTQTPPKPVRVAGGVDSDCTWSPDGGWLLARTPPHKADAQGASLVVVSAAGGAETVVAEAVLASDFTWAADGTIYYWDYQSPQAHAIKPPPAWARDHPGPFANRPILVFVFGGGAPAATYFDVRSGVVASRPITTLANLPRSILRADGFPDGRLLVRVAGDLEGGAGKNQVFDASGKVAAQVPSKLAAGTFAATSVSADGKMIAGEQVADAADGVLSAKLHLMSADGAWNASVDGVEWGANPRLSRVGSWIAFTDAEGRTHVGALRL